MGVEKVKSKLLSNFFTNYDFIVRFLYTQIPFLRDILQKIMAKRMYLPQQSFQDIEADANANKKILDSLNIDFFGKTIMVVGPGTSLFFPLYCLLYGANKVYLIDPFPRLYNEIIQKYIIYFEEKTGKDVEEYIEKKSLKFNERRLCFKKTYLEHIKCISSNSIDIVVSTSVLEHITNIKDSIRELSRVMKIGGVMYHKIDLRDHYNFEEPLKFLKYSDLMWDNFCTKIGYSYTNRLRVDDYLHLLESYKFSNIKVAKKIVKEKININKFDNKFKIKKIEDLQTIACTIMAERVRARATKMM